MSDTFSLFSSVDISYEEYAKFLHKMNATMKTNHVYDALVVENTGSFLISLEKGEEIEKYGLSGCDDNERQELYTLLGGEPKTLMNLDVSTFSRESQAVAVKFVAMIADHYPCVVLGHTSNVYYTAHELIDLRNKGAGFDGFNWQKMEENRRLRELADTQEMQEKTHEETGDNQT